MKKINLYMLLIFIAALTGCDDNVNDHFALPQTNPQEPVQNVEGFTLSLGSSCTAPILFKDLDDATLLEVAKLTDHPDVYKRQPYYHLAFHTINRWSDGLHSGYL